MHMKYSVYILVAAALAPASLAGQSALEMSPNLAGAWTAPAGAVQFNFVHRFDVGPAPLRKLTNTPTFDVGYGLTPWATGGFTYGPNSQLVAGYPNEWAWFGRVAALRRAAGAPLDLVVEADYNLAARSADIGVSVLREQGRARLMGMAAVLGSAFNTGETRVVAGVGAGLRLTRSLVLAGDVSGLPDRRAGETMGWSAGLQVGIPGTPHSLSLHVSNVGTRTLQGLARGGTTRRIGFEYTVPITIRRYTTRQADAPAEDLRPDSAGVVEIEMSAITYTRAHIVVPAGTTVRWVNRDPLAHTVTADDRRFDSDLIEPGVSWQRRFDEPGTFRYHCTPHPFMRGIVVVRQAGNRE